MKYSVHFFVALLLAFSFSSLRAQNINELPINQDILLDFSTQSSIAYQLSLSEASTLNLNARFLGASVPFTLEIFDADGQMLTQQNLSTNTELAVDLPPGQHFVLAAISEGNSARLVLNFRTGSSTGNTSSPAETIAPVTDGSVLSGDWLLQYNDDLTTNCPDQLDLAGAWLAPNGSLHTLNFSNPPQALEFHNVIAPVEISEEPDFFITSVLPDGGYEIIPGIQTAPYQYVYRVIDSQTIFLEYNETLALSDCILSITSTLTYEGAAENQPSPAPTSLPESNSVEDWSVIGEARDPLFIGDAQLCSAALSNGSLWLFDAPQNFVDQVVSAYGETLSFRISDSGASPNTEIVLVVGNGILLSYTLPPATGLDTDYSVVLDENAGWVDVDGNFDPIDAELFQQMLSDVTRVQIQGHADTCLSNPRVGDAADLSSGSETVPYYVISQTDPGDGIPVGCDGFMIAQDSGQPFSANPTDNIRASINPLLVMPSTVVGSTGYTNYLGGQDLSLGNVSVDANGHATVEFLGQFLLIGTCGDPQIEAQILLGIFADPNIESATVLTNGQNLKAMADMSGMTDPDSRYTRDDIPLRS